jgi:hypothetical protein
MLGETLFADKQEKRPEKSFNQTHKMIAEKFSAETVDLSMLKIKKCNHLRVDIFDIW